MATLKSTLVPEYFKNYLENDGQGELAPYKFR